MFDLQGRVALVTGAGQGVGAEIARVLAAHGAAVAVNDLFEDRAEVTADAIGDAGGKAAGFAADITDAEDVAAMVAAVEDRLGPIDVLVNNAGVPPNAEWDLLPFHETTPESWATWIDVNLWGVLRCCHATVGGMAERGWGRVVTIVSDGGRIGEPNMAVYCAAKAAAMGFSRSLAKELGGAGVTVNCVALGTIWPDDADPALTDRLARSYPVGRVGHARDVAPAVLYLASEEAAWVTGQTLPVDGGYAPS